MGFRKADSGSVKLLGKNIYDMSLKREDDMSSLSIHMPDKGLL